MLYLRVGAKHRRAAYVRGLEGLLPIGLAQMATLTSAYPDPVLCSVNCEPLVGLFELQCVNVLTSQLCAVKVMRLALAQENGN